MKGHTLAAQTFTIITYVQLYCMLVTCCDKTVVNCFAHFSFSCSPCLLLLSFYSSLTKDVSLKTLPDGIQVRVYKVERSIGAWSLPSLCHTLPTAVAEGSCAKVELGEGCTVSPVCGHCEVCVCVCVCACVCVCVPLLVLDLFFVFVWHR